MIHYFFLCNKMSSRNTFLFNFLFSIIWVYIMYIFEERTLVFIALKPRFSLIYLIWYFNSWICHERIQGFVYTNLDPDQGVIKRCRLSWLTLELKWGGGEFAGSLPMSTAVHIEAQINFGDLISYLTYAPDNDLFRTSKRNKMQCFIKKITEHVFYPFANFQAPGRSLQFVGKHPVL